MTQGLPVFRWAAYLAAAMLSCFLSLFCANFGWGSNIFPALAAILGVLEGSFAGGVFGLCLGGFGWLNGGGAEGILCCTVIGLAAGCLEHRRSFGTCLGAALGGLLLAGLVRLLLRLPQGSVAVLIGLAAGELVCSLVLASLACPLFLLIRRR